MPSYRLMDKAIRRVAENKIRQAMEAGAFENLPGAGRTLADVDHPYDPHWWLRKWIKREKLQQLVALSDAQALNRMLGSNRQRS